MQEEALWSLSETERVCSLCGAPLDTASELCWGCTVEHVSEEREED